ncbi:MAG: DUF5131 family protein [Armatimonadota bacterium]
MADKTGIEWTDATWNPIRGCTRVSEGCRNCYAERVAGRFSGPGQPYEGLARMTASGPRWTGAVCLVPEHLEDPIRWRKPRRIFVNSMSDLFHEGLGDAEIARVFEVICRSLKGRQPHERHTYQILTKRAERMEQWFEWAERKYPGWFGSDGLLDLGDVQLGVSVESQQTAEERIPHLLRVPVRVRFLSCEPLLGPVDLTLVDHLFGWINALTGQTFDGDNGNPVGSISARGVDWVIVGGESGPGARPMHPDWARTLRDQCQAAGVAFHFKQWGEWKPISEMPEDEYDPLYEPAPARDPEATRRCRVATRAIQWDGGDGYQLIQGHCGYLTFRVGKKRAGRTLDGRTWDEFPA